MRRAVIIFSTSLLVLFLAGNALAQRWHKGIVQKLPGDYRGEKVDSGKLVILQKLPEGYLGEWVISGKPVYVTKETQLWLAHGSPAVGSYVSVKGMHFEGKFLAYQIKTLQFFGRVQKLPPDGLVGEWIIKGQTVQVTPDTKLKGAKTEIGSDAIVEGKIADGKYVADEIFTMRKKQKQLKD